MTAHLMDNALAQLRHHPDIARRLDGLNTEGTDVEVVLKIEAQDNTHTHQTLTETIQNILAPLTRKKVKVHFTTARNQQQGSGAQSPFNRQPVAGVKTIVAVASAKGGVGKSTVAANLALAMSALGVKTGLADLDLTGPSIPLMLGATTKPETNDAGQMIPLACDGIHIISSGLLVASGQPLVMRGPMIQKTLLQMLHGVVWPDIDILVLDLPPGTGDLTLSLTQKIEVDGVLIVSTPQELALNDVRRGASMFAKVGVPIIGLVENMAYFTCSQCDTKHRLFGGTEGDSNPLANMGIQRLASLPLMPQLGVASDTGRPVVKHAPETPEAQVFIELAQKVQQKLSQSVKP